jgi:antitoxin (DNA-binding transcriptional repressor) of toxin-antitoxin stability system
VRPAFITHCCRCALRRQAPFSSPFQFQIVPAVKPAYLAANKPLTPISRNLPRTVVAVYNQIMAKDVIHISEAEVAGKFASLMARVRAGAEVVIENDARPVAVLHPAEPVRRTISECIALLPEDSTATIDPDFAEDVEAAIESHREPLNPPAWD